MNIKELRELGERLFSEKQRFMLLCQELAENFYPQRADFTRRNRDVGEEFADYLTTSYPVLVRRELGDQISAMLRPSNKEWFNLGVKYTDSVDNEAKRFLERASKIQYRAMYDRVTQFELATKQADNDFGTFGQAVISIDLNRTRDALLYQTWHLRDVAWNENEDRQLGTMFRKWKPTKRDLYNKFKDRVSKKVKKDVSKKPDDKVECWHIEIESDMFDEADKRFPYASIHYDVVNDHIMEIVGKRSRCYVVPQWEKPCESQYAYSPAAITALADARMLQAMTYTLLEAGEKTTNPPLIATTGAVTGDLSIYAGGVTWLDQEYDERLGEAIRPINQDYRGMPIGLEINRDARELLAQAFYLNKLNLPVNTPDMTAFEVGQRVEEYIRGALPLFAPMESSYNGQLCERTFDILMENGAFGAPQDIPESLRGKDVEFKFESPLHEAIESQKGQVFVQSQELIRAAAEMDQSVTAIPDIRSALREALEGIGVPAAWVNSKDVEQQIISEQQEAQRQQAELDQLEQGARVARDASQAA